VLAESWQLIIKRINIPAIVKVNDTDYIILDCDYDLQNTSSKGLVVKWFFNTNQVVYQWIYGSYPLADKPIAKYVDLTYKASNDPYTEYRAVKLNKPGIDLTGDYTCVVSTFADERTANASMMVYCKYQFIFIYIYNVIYNIHIAQSIQHRNFSKISQKYFNWKVIHLIKLRNISAIFPSFEIAKCRFLYSKSYKKIAEKLLKNIILIDRYLFALQAYIIKAKKGIYNPYKISLKSY